jgi:formylglycine-generating enzyme required for sulfatase activity
LKKLIFLLAVSLLSQTIVAQKEAYFKHEPTGDGVFFSGTMKYFPNVKGGLEFRVIISDINIEAISFEGKKYDTRYFKAPNKEDIKGTIYFSGKAYHGYDFRQTWFNNCGITIELSKNTTTANMLQDNGSAYFSEAITDNYFENKTAFEASVKSDIEGGGANWVKYWKDYGTITHLKADRYINLHLRGTNNTTVFDYIKNQIIKKQQDEEFYNLRLQLSDNSRDGRTQQEYEEALKLIDAALIKYKDENYQVELVKFKNDVLAQIDKLKNSIIKSNSTNVSQSSKSDNSNKNEELKKEKKKTIIRYSPEQLARINAQIAYQNNVSNYQAKGLDYNSAHRMAQNDSKIEAMDKLGKEVSKQLGNMVVNILEERDRKIEERENKHYGHVKYVKNYIEAIKKNNQIFLKDLKKLPLFDNDSKNIDDLKIEILYLINTLGNYQFNEGQVIVEKEILDAYFEGDVLKIEYKERCITSSMEYVYLIDNKRDSPILYDLHTISEMDFENNNIDFFYKINWTNGVSIPNKNSLIHSKEFYQELKKIDSKVYHKPYFYGIHGYISSSEINRKMDKLKELIEDENEDIILAELNLNLNKKDFNKALELSEKAKEKRGYLSLKNRIAKLKIYHDRKDWLTAKKEYEAIISLKPDNELLNSLKPYVDNIKKNEANALIAEKEFFKAKAVELKPLFEKQLNDFDSIRFSFLPSGKAPVLQLKSSMGISNSSTEKSYLLVDRDNFLIITIPSANALKMLDLENVNYSSYDIGRYSNNVVHYSDVKTSFGKRDLKFRQSDKFSNVYIGGLGDELLWSGEAYTQFEKTLYYYVVNNDLRADIDMFQGGTVNTSFQNPYVENGLLSKTIDYRLVTDENLRKRLERLGFKDVPSSDMNNLNLLKIEAKSSGKTNMIMPCKDITYQMDSKISGKFTLNNQNYKGEHLYFRPANTIKKYGIKVVSTSEANHINIFEDTYFTDKKEVMMVFDLAKTALGSEKELGGLYTWSTIAVKWINLFNYISSAKIVQSDNDLYKKSQSEKIENDLKEIERTLEAFEESSKELQKSLELAVINDIQNSMVLVSGGTFSMGCDNKGKDCNYGESPVHNVTVNNFYIGKFEVTQFQWFALMENNPSRNKDCYECPVSNVSWNDIQQFLSKLNQLTGKSYRLPTEAEWEYAARGGNKNQGFKFSGSNNLDSVGWYIDNSRNLYPKVGEKMPNELGIYDMSGNVWEWCSDWYSDNYYSNSPIDNPIGPSSGSNRVLRGGGSLGSGWTCGVHIRYKSDPDDRSNDHGFRIVLSE